MHEFALGETRRAPIGLAAATLTELRRTRRAIAARSLLNWAEHCSECAMPECYATCSLYTPRPDLKCRRFVRGIERKVAADGASGSMELMSLTFRRWGKLEAVGQGALVSRAGVAAIEMAEPVVGAVVDSGLLPLPVRRKACRAGNLAKNAAVRFASNGGVPDFFLVEVINSGENAFGMTLTIKSSVMAMGLFQGRADITKGYNRLLFPAADILKRLDGPGPFLFQIEPVAGGEGDRPSLTFGVIDFVKLRPHAALPTTLPTAETVATTGAPSARHDVDAPARTEAMSGAPKVKCVVWDLDNTLWAGTLVEDGAEGVRLNARAAALIVELDRRGILNSIASKNSGGAAETLLERFGLAEYFLFPQIHWEPKSRSLGAIANALNIGLDTLVLVDDQIFERSEVQSVHPVVETFDVSMIDRMLALPRFDVPVTEESRKRRSMYQVEQARLAVLDQTGGDYAGFLRGCDIRLVVTELDAEVMGRAFELTERTNQLNYSGRRLSRADLEAKLADQASVVLVLAVSDRFGDYGVVGLAVLDLEGWVVECFFMSCRVQRKKVENAFFAHLLTEGRRRGKSRLSIVYRPTARNEPSREVLEDELAFRPIVTDGEARQFQRDTAERLPDWDIVAIEDRTRLSASLPARLENA